MCLNLRPHCIHANIHKRGKSEIQSTFSLKHYERELSSCPEILATTNVTIATTNTRNRAFQPYQFSNQIQSSFNPTRQGHVGIHKISLTYSLLTYNTYNELLQKNHAHLYFQKVY